MSAEFLRERAAAHGLSEVGSERVTALGCKSFDVEALVTAPLHRRIICDWFVIEVASTQAANDGHANRLRRAIHTDLS